jgi:hypothetical protein
MQNWNAGISKSFEPLEDFGHRSLAMNADDPSSRSLAGGQYVFKHVCLIRPKSSESWRPIQADFTDIARLMQQRIEQIKL